MGFSNHASNKNTVVREITPIWLVFVVVSCLFARIATADVLITKSGTRYEGKVVEVEGRYRLTLPNGDTRRFSKDFVESVEKTISTTGVPAQSPKGAASRPDGSSRQSSASLDLHGSIDSSNTHSADEKLLRIVATGIGVGPDEAVQAAFSQAIEQAIGVLVDAETIVKNDEIVSEKVLMFSKGFVKSYEVVKRWKQDNLHYARITALVEAGELAGRLRDNKIAAREIPGELLARQIRFDVKNEADAAEMLKRILAGFDMRKLAKVEIDGKPEISRDGVNAKMNIKAKVSPDPAQWRQFSKELRGLLGKTAIRRAAITIERGSCRGDTEALAKQLQGDGVLVGLFTTANISGDITQWDISRVLEPMEGAIKDASKRLKYCVAFVLLTQEGEEITRTLRTIGHDWNPARPIYRGWQPDLRNIWWIGPVWCGDDGQFPLYEADTVVVLSQEDLGKVAKVVVSIEEMKGKE